MTNPFTTPTIGADYRASEPPDDDTAVSANAVSWSKHVTKIATPLKNYCDSIITNTTTAFGKIFLNSISSKSGAYPVVVGDRGKLIETTTAMTATMLAAGTAGSGWSCSFRNNSATLNLTVAGNGGSELINGATSITIPPKNGAILTTDGSSWSALFTRGEKSGVMDLLATGTASAAAAINITGMTAIHNSYIIQLENVFSSSDNDSLLMRVSTDGVAYLATNTYDWAYSIVNDSGTPNDFGGAAAASQAIRVVAAVGTAVGTQEALSLEVKVINPSAARWTRMMWTGAMENQTPVLNSLHGAGQQQGTTAVVAVQFLMTAGNITGNYVIYGTRVA